MDQPKLRAWLFARQGLQGGNFATPAEVFEKTGWARSVGGANPYLAAFHRGGFSREALDRAVANVEIHELPSARGCTYVLPATHFRAGLTLAKGRGEPQDVVTAKRHLGLTDAELDRLCESVQSCLEGEVLDPKEIRERVGDATRSLGDEGKKRGMTTTLPLALGRLQNEGRIRRVPVSGRLDQQRYKYTAWNPSPFESGGELTLDESHASFARLYFQWSGPSTKAQYQAISGVGVKASEAYVELLGLVSFGEGDLIGFPEDREAYEAFTVPSDPVYVLAANLDNLSHWRWGCTEFVDEADVNRPAFGPKGVGALGGLSDLENQAIYDRGRLVGLWDYDPESQEVVYVSFVEKNSLLKAAADKVGDFIREQLGDMRSFSLDSPESRKPRLELLRSLAG